MKCKRSARLLAAVLLTAVLFASCGKTTDQQSSSAPETTSPTAEQTSSENESSSSQPEQQPSDPSSEESSTSTIFQTDEENTASTEVPTSQPEQQEQQEQQEQTPDIHLGSADLSTIPADARSWVYTNRFTSIPFELQYAAGGVDKVEAWAESCDWMINWALFIREFDLNAEQIKEILFDEQLQIPPDVTAEEVDILCSDDWAAINQLMVSEYAVAAENGEIYTIFWLGEHTAADYAVAGLSGDAILSAIENCEERNIAEVLPYCESARQVLEQDTTQS